MITDYVAQAEDADQPTIPNYVQEFFNAKLFLQQVSPDSGDNLYDHLTEVLNKILSERPQNVIDFFEEYSRRVKEWRYRPKTDHLHDIFVEPGSLDVATKMMAMFKPSPPSDPSTADPEDLDQAEIAHNNLIELLYYMEQFGLSLTRTEMYFNMLSIKNLIETKPISTIRFWGKIFGTIKNYMVLECELKEDEYVRRNEEYHKELEAKEDAEAAEAEEAAEDVEQSYIGDNEIARALNYIAREQNFFGEDSKYPRQLPPLPKVQYEPLQEPPIETSGVGVNKKVYFVCNGIGEPWIELPDVTPKQIRVARIIYKAFTGNLDEPIYTYPEFPGTEKNFLRAQIARISAGTQISPLGYYTFGREELGEGADEDEAEQEEQPEGGKTNYRVNTKYEPPQLKDLLEPSMSFWVHHAPYILPQGRTTWWNPTPLPDVQDEEAEEELGEEEEEEELKEKDKDKDKRAKVEPETAPPLLTPLSEDASLEAVPPWSVRRFSGLIEKFAIAVVRSNLWPGAFCFSTQGKLFQNVYVGFGLKFIEQNFSPTPLPPVEQDYPIGPEVLEVLDPTGAEEEKWRIDHLPKPKSIPQEELEGEEQEEEEDEEEDEEDED